jgi:hypothetical protein
VIGLGNVFGYLSGPELEMGAKIKKKPFNYSPTPDCSGPMDERC